MYYDFGETRGGTIMEIIEILETLEKLTDSQEQKFISFLLALLSNEEPLTQGHTDLLELDQEVR